MLQHSYIKRSKLSKHNSLSPRQKRSRSPNRKLLLQRSSVETKDPMAIRSRVEPSKTSLVDLTNEAFFAKIFDKYNLTTIDVDANFDKGFEFEP